MIIFSSIIFCLKLVRHCEQSTERRISAIPPDRVRADHWSGRNPGANETVLGRESGPAARLPRDQEDYEQDFNQQWNVSEPTSARPQKVYVTLPSNHISVNQGFSRETISEMTYKRNFGYNFFLISTCVSFSNRVIRRICLAQLPSLKISVRYTRYSLYNMMLKTRNFSIY